MILTPEQADALVLAAVTRPMAQSTISEATGLRGGRLHNILMRLLSQNKLKRIRAVELGMKVQPKTLVYCTPDMMERLAPKPKMRGSGQIASKITIPQYRWGVSRLG